MIKLLLDYSDCKQPDPKATLTISLNTVEQVHLSVANRAERNRTALYQRKHKGAELATRERDPKLAALNKPIPEHYEFFKKSIDHRRVIAFPISDLTANPLRPHYDASIGPEQALLYSNGSDTRLFHLEDEPIGRVPYTLLISYTESGQTRFFIQHGAKVKANDPMCALDAEVKEGLNWWAACPPLLINGDHDLEEYAILDYDLRHVFGFPERPDDEKDDEKKKRQKEQKERLQEMWQPFPNWEDWCKTIRMRVNSQCDKIVVRGVKLPKDWTDPETGYHAALGISEDQKQLILVHRYTTIPNLAEELKGLGAFQAVLLDSGGSCAIWANWVNHGQGGILANHFNFRQPRGAVVFLVLRGERRPKS